MNWLRETLAFTDRQYFSSGVNMLTNSLQISDTTKTEFVELIFCLSYQKNDKNTAGQIRAVFPAI